DFAPQLGTSTNISLQDSAFSSPIMYRNGALWCTHMVYLPKTGATESAALQWWQISAANFVAWHAGRIVDASFAKQYGYPSIAVNRFNDFVIGFSRFSDTQYASADYTYRDACDSGYGEVRSDVVFKDGEDVYRWVTKAPENSNRWGDYSAA